MRDLAEAVAVQLERIARQLRTGEVRLEHVTFSNGHDRLEVGDRDVFTPNGRHQVTLDYKLA